MGIFCFHKWKIIEELPGKFSWPSGRIKKVTKYILQCDKCGDVKSRII